MPGLHTREETPRLSGRGRRAGRLAAIVARTMRMASGGGCVLDGLTTDEAWEPLRDDMPAPSQNLQLRKWLDDPQILLGSYDNILVSVWRQVPTVRVLQDVARRSSELQSELATRLGFLSIINPLPVVPDEELRREMVKVMDHLDSSAFAMAAVIEATGFIGATFRGVVGALNLASRAPYPRKVFGAVSEASTWLSQSNTRAVSSASFATNLIAAATQLRAGSKHR